MTEEGPTIHDTTEQADVAAVANVTHAEVHAVDVPVVEPIPEHPAFRVVLLPLHASPFSLKACAQCEHTLSMYTGYTSVNVHTMDIPKAFHHTLEAKHV